MTGTAREIETTKKQDEREAAEQETLDAQLREQKHGIVKAEYEKNVYYKKEADDEKH